MDSPAGAGRQGGVPSASELRLWLAHRVAEILGCTAQEVDVREPFSSYGLASRETVGLSGELEEWLGLGLEATLLYDHPTIDALAGHLAVQLATSDDPAPSPRVAVSSLDADEPIAIIGMGCRFPGAGHLTEFWPLLRDGIDAIGEVPADRWPVEQLFDRDLTAAGKMSTCWGGFLDRVDLFDARFFGISPREAERMDPQQRLLLEVAWQTFEHAALAPGRLRGSKTGVFVGLATSDYGQLQIRDRAQIDAYVGTGNAGSIAANRISYSFDFQGPSLALDTACSSSLVAVHAACQSLRSGESTLALAGGVNLILLPETTMVFSKAGLMAADGRCKVFAAAADGYVRSEGVGLVLLKPLSSALADGNRIYSQIRGVAVNQDGASNGLTAPNRFAQEEVLRQAYNQAGVSPAAVHYVETHGTGTELGDSIELSALGAVVGVDRRDAEPCAIGSVKSNLGHLEAAAGIAGLIKVVLAFQHRRVPPSLHFHPDTANALLAGQALRVVDGLEEWELGGREDAPPALAGVSSFGFGGTNAHVVLEEPPAVAPSGESRLWQLLLCSAKTGSALAAVSAELADFLESTEVELADVAFTSQLGREALDRRRMVLCRGAAEAAAALREGDAERVLSSTVSPHQPSVSFLFADSKLASLEPVLELYSVEGYFRRQLDHCRDLLRAHTGLELIDWLKATAKPQVAAPRQFSIQYSLARMWMAWGVEPGRLIGVGVGLDVAACLAGVFTLEEALLRVAVGSALVDRSLAESAEIELLVPRIPLLSLATGRQVDLEEAENSDLWSRSASVESCTAVLRDAAGEEGALLLEIGPDDMLSGLARKLGQSVESQVLCSLVVGQLAPQAALLHNLGQLWLAGVEIDWRAFNRGEQRSFVDLPTYPFERQSFWFGPPRAADSAAAQLLEKFDDSDPRLEFEDWFTVPQWCLGPSEGADGGEVEARTWLFFLDRAGLGQAVAARLERDGHRVYRVLAGAAFSNSDDGVWTIDPTAVEDYRSLLAALDQVPQQIVHLWNFDHCGVDSAARERQIELSFYSLLFLAQAVDRVRDAADIDLTVVSSGLHRLPADPASQPEKALLTGPCRVLPLELPWLSCHSVDLEPPPDDAAALQLLVDSTVEELTARAAGGHPERVAYRAKERWVERFQQVAVEPAESALAGLRQGGVYLITGGLGGVGLGLAEELARSCAARIVLLGRSALPQRDTWQEVVEREAAAADGPEERIRKILAIEKLGSEVLILQADVADSLAMGRAIQQATERFGGIDGVFHAAGIPGAGLVRFKTRQMVARALAAKVQGTRVLEEVLASLELDFVVLFSSVIAVTGGGIGQLDYCAANAFLDAMAVNSDLPGRVLSINWGWWQWGLWDQSLAGFRPEFQTYLKTCRARYGVDFEQGMRALVWCLGQPEPQLIVSPRAFAIVQRDSRRATAANLFGLTAEPVSSPGLAAGIHPRPELSTRHVPPASELEQQISEIWRRGLGLDRVGRNDNFFDLGGNSLIGQQLTLELASTLGLKIDEVSLYEAPTVATLAQVLSRGSEPREAPTQDVDGVHRGGYQHEDIAIVGMAGRFPGARSSQQLWQLLVEGREGISTFSDPELLAAGVAPELIAQDNYVKSRPVLDDVDLFDASFFDFTPSEARLTDPQQRLFLECSWEALEDAGQDPEQFGGAIGVFAGTNISTYWLSQLADPEMADMATVLSTVISNDKDSLSTRTAYKLDLRGPAVSVQTHCSTSLVAVHMARQSLLSGDSDLVLAGGSAIRVPVRVGYLYQEGGTDSADGHTRSFDAAARGTPLGDGVAVVALKRLSDARRDGNQIYAVIKGSAINNDGSLKVGFHAPSVDGQAAVVAAALAEAGVEAESVSYVEAHGTATPLGDPIEFAALTKAFRQTTKRLGFCGIGSAKSNLGHLDKASGVTGLIKTALALRHRRIPATLHFERPNPKLHLSASPFFVVSELTEWESVSGPRRAGVNSLGMGGTNVHVVLEEAPSEAPSGPARQWQLLLVSARTDSALATVCDNLCGYLEENPSSSLADVAYTLMLGRRAMEHRRLVVADQAGQAVSSLRRGDSEQIRSRHHDEAPASVTFQFTDLTAGADLWGEECYRREKVYREVVDQCAERFGFELGPDRELESAPPWLAAALLFANQLALGRQLLSWGIRPSALQGQGLGEAAAACLAGVLSLGDAADLVGRRARELAQVASVTPNGVAPGESLTESLGAPAIPLLSPSGIRLSAQEVTDPAYWRRWMSRPLDCPDATEQEADDRYRLLLEIGVGQQLDGGSDLSATAECNLAVLGFESTTGSGEQLDEIARLLRTVGELWLRGVDIDGAAFFAAQQRRRLALPTYPFERQSYWVESSAGPSAPDVPAELKVYLAEAPAAFDDWLYSPQWRPQPLPLLAADPLSDKADPWLLLVDSGGLGAALAARLEQLGQVVWVVEVGAEFVRHNDRSWTLRPAELEDFRQLLADLDAAPRRIVHLWSLAVEEVANSIPEDCLVDQLEYGFYSLLACIQGLGELRDATEIELTVVSSGIHRITGEEVLHPQSATLLGPCRVAPLELPLLRCRSLDLDLHGAAGEASWSQSGELRALLDELMAEPLETAEQGGHTVAAYRQGERWVETFVPLPAPEEVVTPLRQGGVYLITGGLGGLGLGLAEHLVRHFAAKLVLVSRTRPGQVADRLERLQELEDLGAEVLVLVADVTVEVELRRAVEQALEHFGKIDGVVHAAGVPGAGLAQLKTREMAAQVLAPKIQGSWVLDRVFADHQLDFMALFSSVVALTGGGPGQVDYCAANAFLDAFAAQRSARGQRTIAIDWNEWQWDAWQEGLTDFAPQMRNFFAASRQRFGIDFDRGGRAFERALAQAEARIVVTPRRLPTLFELGRKFTLDNLLRGFGVVAAPARTGDTPPPDLSVEELERRVAEILQRLLGVEQVGVDDNFFDLGGNSLLGLQVTAELKQVVGRDVPATLLYEAPTASTLARALAPAAVAAGGAKPRLAVRRRRATGPEVESHIAIIGMAGRFPGARNTTELWRNLQQGVESVTFFSDEELRAAGVEEALLRDPTYVKAGAVLEDIDRFDAELFGYSPREAELMDPQHRFFLEAAWEALENAGYDSQQYGGAIGVFGGSNISTYLLNQIISDPQTAAAVDPMQAGIVNSADSLTTKVSYKLGLTGPSIAVQTFCSTSAVANHLACRSLARGDCDLALAGGVRIAVPHRVGYQWQTGSIDSPDGHTRAFDAAGQGAVVGNAVALLVLKRLDEAQADGDQIYAVIRGTAMNNDGSLKVGYTAPSVDTQAQVIAAAMVEAGVEPATLSYVEAHGTGTELGDPIEVAALSKAFADVGREFSCALGSVKTNMGHLDRAAGATSLIKTALALHHSQIPASLHFKRPNPETRLAESPFCVNTELTPWPAGEAPRRAGVNALGIGGTNVHFVLEEAPPAAPASPSRAAQLVVLSAKTEAALEQLTDRLAEHLQQHPEAEVADFTHTLQRGRRLLPHRRVLVGKSVEDLGSALAQRDPQRLFSYFDQSTNRSVAFLFPGLGDQYVGMAQGLYDSEPTFRRHLDLCAEKLVPWLDHGLLELLFPAAQQGGGEAAKPDLRSLLRGGVPSDDASRLLNRTANVHPAIFAVEYSLAQLLIEWVGEPQAMAGYSLGEYTAACLSGVLSLDAALELVTLRAQMIDQLPPGGMLAVPLSRREVEPLLGSELSLAAVNGPAMSVLAGSEAAIAALAEHLTAKEVACRRLATSHAFHSYMMEPIVEPFTRLLEKTELRRPRIPFVSNVTGRWILDEEAMDPAYWAHHLCRPVLFHDCLQKLIDGGDRVLVEVGPGQSLGSMVKQHPAYSPQTAQPVLATLPAAFLRQPDQDLLLRTLGKLWLAGVRIDWTAFYRYEKRRRVPLPTYPFADQRFWIGPEQGRLRTAAVEVKGDPEEWFYRPIWRPTDLSPSDPSNSGEEPAAATSWLLLADALSVGRCLAERLTSAGHRVTTVVAGAAFERQSASEFVLDPGQADQYQDLLKTLHNEDRLPSRVVDLWSLSGSEAVRSSPFEETQERGFYSLIHLVRAFCEVAATRPWAIDVVANGLWSVAGTEKLWPEKATLLGPCKVIPQEYPQVACRVIDLEVTDSVTEAESLSERLRDELAADLPDRMVALRASGRWVQDFESAPLASPEGLDKLRREGVYLITGGLGGIGFVLAEYLARELDAKLILTGRSELPARDSWAEYVDNAGIADELAHKIRRLQRLEELGAEVLVLAADVADPERMQQVVEQAEERFGTIDGLLHAAGLVRPEAFGLLAEISREKCVAHFRPKVQGLWVLEQVLADRKLDFRLLFSSTSAVLGGLTMGAYASANLFMDAFAEQRNRRSPGRWTTVNWDIWEVHGDELRELREHGSEADLGEFRMMLSEEGRGMTAEQGIEAFRRVLASSATHLVHSPSDLGTRLEQWIEHRAVVETVSPSLYARPNLQTPFVAAQSFGERRIAEIFQRILGVEEVGLHDNYFDLGGTSLTAIQVTVALQEEFGGQISPNLLFAAPSVSELAKRLLPQTAEQPTAALAAAVERRRQRPSTDGRQEIAIIGMAGRFPGARDVEEFWSNLEAGVETLSIFSDEELLAAGVPEEEFKDPNYVRVRPVLDGVELFDSAFFGFSPREAELMDPQHRVFLETAWTALEHAGYDAQRYAGAISLFAGSNISTYLLGMLGSPEFMDSVSELETAITNDRDSLTTRVSYKLNLRGPSMAVQTFCSTSLVATHLGAQSLLTGESDIALAGGVSIRVPQKVGYRFDPGGQDSPDGHTRSFDAKAQGTVFGDGVGVVVMKRLADALADRDTIHAVIKGSAINNDGSLKIGYTAPSIEGQAEAIAMALDHAGVRAESIGYVEAHGSATDLGDPVEAAALTKAFRLGTEACGFCAIGSVKSNFGHLDRAAGVAGLIKTVLALREEVLPPTLHFEEPNPKIELAASPFFVNNKRLEWKSNGRPRRAGVNSLGVGGTNVHVVLEEAPQRQPSGVSRAWQLLPISARTVAARDTASSSLASLLLRESMGSTAKSPLPDVAFTLQMGRREFEQRRFAVTRDAEEAVAQLAAPDADGVSCGRARKMPPRVVFLFPTGDHYLDMSAGLYQQEAVFRQEVDRCAELLEDELDGIDLRQLLFSGMPADAVARTKSPPSLRHLLGRGGGERDEAAGPLNELRFSQPATFVVEYALARLLMSWGILPQALIGHSMGEYVAACLAGVFSLEGALRLVARRSRLMQERMPAGGILAVPLPEEEVLELLSDELSLAAVNAPSVSLVSGPKAALDALQQKLESRDLICQRLAANHLIHSPLLAEIGDEVRELLREAQLAPPQIPFVSNLTGTWIEPAQATDPEYWIRHMCETVRFADGVRTLLEEPEAALIEVGPGQGLCSFVKLHPECRRGHPRVIAPTLRPAHETRPDQAFLLDTVGRLWAVGVGIDWSGFSAGEERHRLPLPTYPFERQRFWIEPLSLRQIQAGGAALAGAEESAEEGAVSLDKFDKNPEPSQWFFVPVWNQTVPSFSVSSGQGHADAAAVEGGSCLVLGGEKGLGSRLVERLVQGGLQVTQVTLAESFTRLGRGTYALDPCQQDQIRQLLAEMKSDQRLPDRVIHLWSLSDEAGAQADEIEAALDRGFYPLISLAQAMGDICADRALRLAVVSDGLQSVTGEENLRVEVSPLIGPCRVIPQEYPQTTCHSIDVVLPPADSPQEGELLEQLFAELAGSAGETMIALRGGRRWVQEFEPLELPAGVGQTPLRREGVYLITGGLGGIGLAVARHLFATRGARLALLSRSGLPTRETWAEQLEVEGSVADKIHQVMALEEAGAEVLVLTADVADRRQMQRAVDQTLEAFGTLNGVFHTAGVPAAGLMQLSTREAAAAVLTPKVQGTLVLAQVTAQLPLDFMLLFSSMNSATGGGPGQVDYSAANAFLDAFAVARSQAGQRVLALDWGEWQWDAWQEGLMGFDPLIQAFFKKNRRKFGVSFEEGMTAIERTLSVPVPRVVVSTVDFRVMLRLSRHFNVATILEAVRADQGERPFHPRPLLGVSFVAPASKLEQQIAGIWRQLLRLEEIGVHDSFFELGGNSLLGVDLTRIMKDALRVEIPMYALYESSTVRAMTEFVEQSGDQSEHLDQRRERGASRRQRAQQQRRRGRTQRGPQA